MKIKTFILKVPSEKTNKQKALVLNVTVEAHLFVSQGRTTPSMA